MKHITTDEVSNMTDMEGLVLQGCGGPLDEWVDGINQLLTEEGILRDGDTFRDIYVFEHDGLTNMLFNMEDVNLDVGRLAIWRLQSHDTFGGTWLSDYLPNKLGIIADHDSHSMPEKPSVKEQIAAAGIKQDTADKPQKDKPSKGGPEL